jgi:hypothetical protein
MSHRDFLALLIENFQAFPFLSLADLPSGGIHDVQLVIGRPGDRTSQGVRAKAECGNASRGNRHLAAEC